MYMNKLTCLCLKPALTIWGAFIISSSIIISFSIIYITHVNQGIMTAIEYVIKSAANKQRECIICVPSLFGAFSEIMNILCVNMAGLWGIIKTTLRPLRYSVIDKEYSDEKNSISNRQYE